MKPADRAFIKPIQIVYKQLPKSNPKSRKGFDFDHLKSSFLKQICQTVSAVTIKIPWLLVQVPDKGDTINCTPVRLEHTETFSQCRLRFLQMLQDRCTDSRIKGSILQRHFIGSTKDINLRLIMNG